MSTNDAKGFNYSISLREAAYLLFKKKRCPKCNGAMDRHKDYTVVSMSSLSDHGHFGAAPVKDYKFHFICTGCKSNFPLSELANRGK